jgi:hypothetical protein
MACLSHQTPLGSRCHAAAAAAAAAAEPELAGAQVKLHTLAQKHVLLLVLQHSQLQRLPHHGKTSVRKCGRLALQLLVVLQLLFSSPDSMPQPNLA